jgi:hypothetical protein
VITWSTPHAEVEDVEDTLYPQYNKADYCLINDIINCIDWNSELADTTCTEAWEILHRFLTDISKYFIPHSPKPTKCHRTPWLSSSAKRDINIKARKWKTYQAHPDGRNWRIYTIARNRATGSIRSAKRAYEEYIAIKSKSNIKLLHSYFRSKRKTKSTRAMKLPDGSITTDKSAVADCMNQYFQSVFNRPVQHVPNDSDCTEPAFCNISIDINDVLLTLRACNPTKAPGPDGIHSAVLHHCADSLAKPLYIIFNKSLEEATVPTDWKDAVITPIHKSGDPTLPGNYRPISLTSQVAKILERLIGQQLRDFLEQHNIFSKHQHGFRNGYSCLTNLLESLNYWTDCVDRRVPCDAILLDIRKAFDTVDHSILLKKLMASGIHGAAVRWIMAFLLGRRQCVSVEGTRSTWVPVDSGVPQGTVLGPLLFLVYISDLPDVITSLCNLFADDTKIYRELGDDTDYLALQQDLNAIQAWATENKLTFNTDKCEVIHLGHNNPHHTYFLGGVPLNHSDQVKSLGVVFDRNLKPSTQCLTAAKKANRALGQIKRCFSFINMFTMRLLYTTYVRPHLDYCVQAWSPYLVKDRAILEAVQRRATRLVPCLRSLPYPERLRRIGLQDLDTRRLRGDILETYKIVHGIDRLPQNCLFKQHSLTTRGHSHRFYKPYARTLTRSSFYANRVVNQWNALPENIVCAPSVSACKARLDKHLMV